jgi:hypothetical protein
VDSPLRGPSGISQALFEKKSWGRDLELWVFRVPFSVEHLKTVDPFAAKPVHEVRQAKLNTAQLRALASAIARVEAESARPEGCEERVTDGPYGKLEWFRDEKTVSVKWDANCLKGRDADLRAAVGAADKIVREAAMATPVVERR